MLAHLLAEEKVLKRILNPCQVSNVLFILSSQVEEVGEYAPEAKYVDNRYESHHHCEDYNVERSAQILTNLGDETISHHDLHFGLAVFCVFVIDSDDLIVPDYKGRLLFCFCLSLHHSCVVHQRCSYVLSFHD